MQQLTNTDEYLTVESRPALRTTGSFITVKNIVPECTALLGVSSQVRQEAKTLFWRFSPFRLRPGAVDCLNIPTCRQMRKVLLEVIHPSHEASSFAFDHAQFVKVMPQLLGLPALEYIDLSIDAPSLRDCISIDREGYCQEHRNRIAGSEILRRLARTLDQNWAGYMHFRLHLTHEAEVRTYKRVIARFRYMRDRGNTLNPCDEHLLGQCKTITCRLLHAIEEVCQPQHRPGLWLYSFKRRIAKWNEESTIWEPDALFFPVVVSLMDLKGEKGSRHSPVEEQLFDILYMSGPSLWSPEPEPETETESTGTYPDSISSPSSHSEDSLEGDV